MEGIGSVIFVPSLAKKIGGVATKGTEGTKSESVFGAEDEFAELDAR